MAVQGRQLLFKVPMYYGRSRSPSTLRTFQISWRADADAGMGRQAPAPIVNGEVRQSVKVGKLNLVDLAGSERVHITGATGQHSHPDCTPGSAGVKGTRAQPGILKL